jgi:hypothetical protein
VTGSGGRTPYHRAWECDDTRMSIPENADKEKLAEMALAMLHLTSFSDKYATRAWKGLDWDLLDLLFEKGWISDPKGKAKSVVLSEDGARLSAEFFERHFGSAREQSA